MAEHWEDTTAGVLARIVGQAGQPTPEQSRWAEQRATREAYAREFYAARGWLADDGSIRPRTTQPDGRGGMVTVDLYDLADEHQRGGTWIGPGELRSITLTAEELEDAKLAKILGKLAAQQHARAAAASAQSYGPGDTNPGYVEAARRIAAGQ